MAVPYGYTGKILHVDLATRTGRVEEPDEAVWRRFGGGGLLGTKLLWEHLPAGSDALDPANPLIFLSSVVAGQPYPGLARFTVVAKSPLTGGVGETRCEGPWGWALKGCGADVLLLHGAASTPTVLLVEDGAVAFIPAADLWGLEVGPTTDRLEDAFGRDIHVAAIGPAGERRVRFASIVTDRCHNAFRHGLGAVMGAKGVKAVVLRGDARPPVADPAACAATADSYAARMPANDLTRWQLEPPGFAAWVHTHGVDAALCTRNYRDSVFMDAAAYDPAAFLARFAGESPCPGCPNLCVKRFAPAGGDPRAAGLHQEAPGALGPNLGIADLDAVFAANERCNQLGLDPVSLGFTLSWAAESAERGVLAEPDAPRFGDAPAMLAAIEAIGNREGLGDLLAEGSRRAADTAGQGSEAWALHVKGLEMVPFEPRTQTNLALGYAVAPAGPRYDICEHDWDFDPRMGWGHTLDGSRALGILDRIEMDRLTPAKVRNFKALLTIWSAADALDLCPFAIAPTRVLTLPDLARLLAAVTGWETSDWEIMRLGERRLHLMQAFNRREGLTAAADTLPDRFFDEPIGQGRWAGTHLDRAAFAASVLTFYRMMGWDDGGVPTEETLIDHDLAWAAQPPREAMP